MILLARYAECIFWFARYVERAENLARILDVQETFSRDNRGQQNWLSVIQINADEERFKEAYGEEISAETVIRFYLTDMKNPSSIQSSIRAARENARTLRPLISTEMWSQLNIFYNRLRELTEADATPHRLPQLCVWIKEACQAHTGITEGTFYRDQGWYFYQLGRLIERADQTTRIVDIKYHHLLPSVADVGSPVDVAQWNALLRSAAGYHAYRRKHPSGMKAETVAGFLLLDDFFPRSVRSCVQEADRLLLEMRTRFNLRGGGAALETLDELRAVLGGKSIRDIVRAGLHEFNDMIQMQLGGVTNDLAHDFFGGALQDLAGAA
ncbi:MAG: alpha-E domain-containing protein [Alphaproteobacteria bacterium]|nr:MAG: alpha-E domain-containing protein [Alphaproteobacteria bacterium]